MIRAWIDLWDRREPPTALALVRVGVAAVMLFDLLMILHLDLVELLFAPWEAGGLADPLDREVLPWIYSLLPAEASTAWIVWGGATAAAVALLLGGMSRLSALALMLLYAQLGRIFPMADRGIDMLLRNALMILSLSACGGAWSLDARLKTGRWSGDGAPAPAWPRHLLILQLAVVYFAAGVQKTAHSWWPTGGFNALYLVLQDPAVARFDPTRVPLLYPLSRLGTAGTMVFEWGASLIPLAYGYRPTADRPGRLRAAMNRWRYRDLWVTVGVMLHLGIAASMNLGIFPFAMLALYPAFFHHDEWSRVPIFRADRSR